MKTDKIKSRLIAIAALTMFCFTAYNTVSAQTQAGSSTSGDKKNSKNIQTPNTANRQADLQNAGSSAQVRHDRTGTLNPGAVGGNGTSANKPKNNSTTTAKPVQAK